jgi:methyl-accepting chemotaxis protein
MKLKIGARFGIIFAILMAFTAVVSGIGLKTLYDNLVLDRQDKIRSVVDSAQSVVKSYAQRVKSGEWTEDAARQRALQTIGAMRFGGDGKDYLWVNDSSGVFLSHPTKTGASALEAKDANGFSYMKAFIEAAKRGGDFVGYDWIRDEGKPPVEKLSYVAPFAEWGWVIGTGVYIDDIHAVFLHNAALVAGMALFSLCLGGVAVLLVRRTVVAPIKAMTSAMDAMAKGDLGAEIPATSRTDEIGEMARSTQIFKNDLLKGRRLEQDAKESEVREREDRARRQAEAAAREVEMLRAAEEQRQKSEAEALANERAVVVGSIGAGLARLAEKDLTWRLTEKLPPAYARLQDDFNAAVEQLASAFESVSASTDSVHSGSSEITIASNDLSRRTAQQAASLEETAAALDEITATVKKTAEGAKLAREATAITRNDAQHGGEVVRKAVDAMSKIEESSRQISQIIGVIDEIALQTNLLALNAGVEATRAGDAGRGFGVVASEVRALAQRSADAAKEIKGLIFTSSAQVGEGVALVAETGKALEQIEKKVAEINFAVSDISTSAQEQAIGLQQVNSAVNQMDHVTQQNAAMSEQATAASQQLAQETERLMSLIGAFRIGRGPGAQRREAPKATRAYRRSQTA